MRIDYEGLGLLVEAASKVGVEINVVDPRKITVFIDSKSKINRLV